MTYKQIEASREVRLWIGQVIVPAITAGVMLASQPGVRKWCGEKVKGIKKTTKKFYQKVKSK